MMRKLIGAGIIAALLIGSAAHATVPSRFGHYFDRLTGNVLIVKRTCLQGEDSAAHLKLLGYYDGGGRIVLGCRKGGY
jgi:hypothetical protein